MGPAYSSRTTSPFLMTSALGGKKWSFFSPWVGLMGFFCSQNVAGPTTFSGQKKPLPLSISWSVWGSPAQGDTAYSEHRISHLHRPSRRASVIPTLVVGPAAQFPSRNSFIASQANCANVQLLISQTPSSSCWGKAGLIILMFTESAFCYWKIPI